MRIYLIPADNFMKNIFYSNPIKIIWATGKIFNCGLVKQNLQSTSDTMERPKQSQRQRQSNQIPLSKNAIQEPSNQKCITAKNRKNRFCSGGTKFRIPA